MNDATTIHVLVQAIAVLEPYEKELQSRLDGARKNLRSTELLKHPKSFSVQLARDHAKFAEERAIKATDALMQMKALVASTSISVDEALAHYAKVAPSQPIDLSDPDTLTRHLEEMAAKVTPADPEVCPKGCGFALSDHRFGSSNCPAMSATFAPFPAPAEGANVVSDPSTSGVSSHGSDAS